LIFLLSVKRETFLTPERDTDPYIADLMNPDDMSLYQGHLLPLNNKTGYHPLYNNWAPSVDGTNDTDKSLFMFTYNECKPECCKDSPYSCDKGCVCLTPEQKTFMSSRGGNSHLVNKEYCTKSKVINDR
jgi:hypothetical protein